MPLTPSERRFRDALRRLARELESNKRTGLEKGLPTEIAFDDGVSVGENQAGYQLSEILREFGVIK